MLLSDKQITDIMLEMGSVPEKLQSSAECISWSPANERVGLSDDRTSNDAANLPNGCFADMVMAIAKAKEAQIELSSRSLKLRKSIIQAMRQAAMQHLEELAKLAFEETGYGRISDKIKKNRLAIEKTPGLEDLIESVFSGDDGLTLHEGAPYGVIGAITPSTNPTATIINNAISMISGGNAVVFNPHPGACQSSNRAVQILNQAIFEMCGIPNLLTTIEKPTLESGKVLMNHPDIRLLAITGGEAVVKVAMQSGKKVIAAGPGNPPVIVDETADLDKAASDIVNGSSFDNNVLCIAEKEVFVVASVADRLIAGLIANGCYLADQELTAKLQSIVLTENKEGQKAPCRHCVGRSANFLLEKAGVKPDQEYRLIIMETEANHPFVTTEQLMPILPIVRVRDVHQAIKKALQAENGYHHTAIMHSKHVDHLTAAAKTLDTTIFVKNAPSYAGLGLDGEGFTTLTIATPTGEGPTSARSFVRTRRCALSGSFRII